MRVVTQKWAIQDSMTRQNRPARLRKGKVDRGIEHVRTLPVLVRRFRCEDIDADLVRCRPFLEHPCHTGLKLHGGMVGHHDPPVIKRDSLLPKQAFGGTDLQRIGLAIQDVAKMICVICSRNSGGKSIFAPATTAI